MRTKKQRFISILLTLAMVIGLMSGLTVTAYAADTFTVHPWRVNSSNDYGALTTDAALPYNTTTSALMKKVGFSQSLDQDSGFSIASVAITSGSNVALGTPTGTAGQKGYDVPVTINGEGEFVLKIQRTNGYYDVEIRVVVSKNENTPVNEWSENKSITADTTIDGGVLVTADVKVTIAEGKTLTVNGGINATDHTLTVKGPGTLIVNGTNGDVGEEGGTAFTGNLVVDDGAVTMTGGKGGNFSMLNAPGVGGHGVNGNVTVNGGSIKVFGGNGNYSQIGDGSVGGNGVNGDLTVNGGNAEVSGGKGGRNSVEGFASPGQAVTGTITGIAEESDDNSNWSSVSDTTSAKQYIKVAPLTKYPLWVGETQVTSVNLSGSGWSFTPADGTTPAALTLSGATISTYSGENINTYGIFWNDKAALNIVLAADTVNTVTPSGAVYGIYSNGSVAISGTGTLTAAGTGSSGAKGIYAKGLTISGGTVNFGGTNGIYCYGYTVTISGGTVTATGDFGAIKGSVKNSIAGLGWENKDGSGNSETIAISDSARDLSSYQKVWFTPHTHSFTNYSVSGATVTATCNADDCPLENGVATLTIAAPTSGGSAATLTGASDFAEVTVSAIKYYTKSGSDWIGETSTPPGGTGFYKASVTVSDGINDYTAEVTYGVNAISKDTAFEPTAAHGDITVPTIAAVGAAVEITTTPDAGYVLDALTVKKAGGGTVTSTKDGNTASFTMPDENVTVSASFIGRDVPVALTVSGNAGTPCTAELLTKDFAPVGESFTSRAGEKFVLSVSTDDDYDYTVKFNNKDSTASLTKFSDEDYQTYAEYLEKHKLTVSAQTELFWVTMPAIATGNLNITATFGKVDSFTVLYQPTTTAENTDTVWCKFTDSQDRVYAAEMTQGLNINGITIWSVSLKSAFDPGRIAFVTVSKSADAETLKAAIDGATLVTCSPQTNTEWKTISGGQYMLIGGNAKAVAAAFVNGDDVKMEIGVCPTDAQGRVTADGTVKAPAGLEKAGFTFGGWRGVKYDANGKASEKIYAAGDSVPVRGNITINAVWDPIVPKITLDANGGEGGSNVTEVNYLEKLTIEENPTKKGYAFVDWIVSKNVTENGKFFHKGVSFDFSSLITDDLKLEAEWKHVHAYSCVPLNYPGFNGAMNQYSKYFPYIHVRFCGCADVKLEAHTFLNGVCTECGYTKPGSTEVQLEVSYWKDGATSAWLNDPSRTVKRNEEVTVDAFDQIGHYAFSKWQYSTDSGATWNDLASATMVGFIIPCSMQVRAIYVSTITQPQIELSARSYETYEQGYNWDTVLFQMNYKLPDGYTFVDAGVRMGDNEGISYYEIKEYKQSTGQKAAEVGFNFGMNMIPFVGGGLTGFLTDQTKDLIMGDDGPQYYYEKRENSALDEYTAATLSKYMFEKKPVNVEKYPPIYWEAKTQTKSQTGSVNTLTPLRFIQKNNGNHYIYGMAWMIYKTPDGVTGTIYTEAIPVTRNNPNGYAKATTQQE